ncbi:glutamate-5-semialdehyde dehydrogenase [Muribaculum caecicola]|uniref:Glutamate-5-semialdehyde dehydrogenase n=1 Tax=Muribaculum caecicola TaxID=3038144 RepID=A0AC61S366_9BACT|nr:glutamate-5-semialdehyde dehydrogenase [Muribaculum caecicola]THG43835.1 glutamate-5-semialdehyde dehydrogenase [Muribaculum caecicola]
MPVSVIKLLENARRAALDLQSRHTPNDIDLMLLAVAQAIEDNIEPILNANALDLNAMDSNDPRRDRLMLDPSRLHGIATDMRNVASLPSPLYRVLETATRPNGLVIEKVTVPFGVIGVIYEARPNVTFDVFALCIKAGSACVLKGGHEADNTNRCSVEIIRNVLQQHGWDNNLITLLPPGHDATNQMLHASGYVDLVIPRGSRRLIDFVRENSRVPVIETGAGVCHTYIHESAHIDMARNIVCNAKTRRVSVCNALDTLVIDRNALSMLPDICQPMATSNVLIYADSESYAALDGKYPLLRHASENDFGHEWLDYKMSIKTVSGPDQAIDFIQTHTSHHSECIVASDSDTAARFQREIDAACVYANAPTAFTDGAQFGFGAEIGISTQKLHARGPMALPELTTYKYVITGNGQTRP